MFIITTTTTTTTTIIMLEVLYILSDCSSPLSQNNHNFVEMYHIYLTVKTSCLYKWHIIKKSNSVTHSDQTFRYSSHAGP
jgi:hypothetical protein